MLVLSEVSTAWRCIKPSILNVSSLTDVEIDATNERPFAEIDARVSEFIRFNVCGRLIQGATKRLGVSFMDAEKGRGGSLE